MLTYAVSLECLQPVASQAGQIPESVRAVKDGKAPRGLIGECLEACNPSALEEPPRVPVLETPNHASRAKRSVYYAFRKASWRAGDFETRTQDKLDPAEIDDNDYSAVPSSTMYIRCTPRRSTRTRAGGRFSA